MVVPHCIKLKNACCQVNELGIGRWSYAVKRWMDASKGRAGSPEHYHCNPILDALRPERSAPRSATGFHSWLFVHGLHRITL